MELDIWSYITCKRQIKYRKVNVSFCTSNDRPSNFTLCCNLKWDLKFECRIFKVSPISNWGRVSLYAIADNSGIYIIEMQSSRTTHRIIQKPSIYIFCSSEWFHLYIEKVNRRAFMMFNVQEISLAFNFPEFVSSNSFQSSKTKI